MLLPNSFYAYLLRDSVLLSKAIVVVEPQVFIPGEEPIAVFWDITSEWYRAHHVLPSLRTLLEQANYRMQSDQSMQADYTFREGLQQIMNGCAAADEQVLREDERANYVDVLNHWLRARIVRPMMQDASATHDIAEFKEKMDEAIKTSEAKTVVHMQAVDIMYGCPDIDVSRQPTGFGPVDTILGGGIRGGESYGYVASTGGGKSTMGLHLCLSTIEVAQKRTCFVSYEMPPYPILMHRILSYRTALPTSYFASNNIRKLSDIKDPEVFQKVKDWWHDLINPNFQLMDLTGKNMKGIPAVASHLYDQDRTGKLPVLTVIDQHRFPVQRLMDGVDTLSGSDSRKGARPQTFQDASQSVMVYLSHLAKATGTAIMMLHQRKATFKTQPPAAIPNTGEANGDGSFENWTDTCFTQSNIVKHLAQGPELGLCVLAGTKTRDAEPALSIIRMHGAASRFVDVNMKYELSGGEFIETSDSFIRSKSDRG